MNISMLLRYLTLILALLSIFAGTSLAREVYLKDGGIIECESFWRRGSQVVVKVNRDVVIELEPGEVDLKRTFRQAGKKSRPGKPVKAAGKTAKAPASAPGTKAAEAASSADPAGPESAPAAAKKAEESGPAAPAAKVTPPPAQNEAPAAEPAEAAPPAPPTKAELERRSGEMMAEAIQKKDPEMMKKAVALAQSAQQQDAPAPKGAVTTYLLLLLVCFLLVVASMWKVFTKANRSGITSLIPVYNMYILMQISGKPGWWVVILLIPGLNLIFYLLAMLGLAQRFGRGAAYGIGLWFMPVIFFPLLAFGEARYEG